MVVIYIKNTFRQDTHDQNKTKSYTNYKTDKINAEKKLNQAKELRINRQKKEIVGKSQIKQ